mmetsp:Transcript_3030/g.11727  ORF Transcript_3030/g.11727 Transcript_3030/m.11727 type:complete len:230 (+) Transcript_3030:692-1381(+)
MLVHAEGADPITSVRPRSQLLAQLLHAPFVDQHPQRMVVGPVAHAVCKDGGQQVRELVAPVVGHHLVRHPWLALVQDRGVCGAATLPLNAERERDHSMPDDVVRGRSIRIEVRKHVVGSQLRIKVEEVLHRDATVSQFVDLWVDLPHLIQEQAEFPAARPRKLGVQSTCQHDADGDEEGTHGGPNQDRAEDHRDAHHEESGMVQLVQVRDEDHEVRQADGGPNQADVPK